MNATFMRAWVVKPTAGHDIHGQSAVYDQDTGLNIAIVYDGERDGNLIAAAPDLLAACQLVIEADNECGSASPRKLHPITRTRLELAIARAEGT